MRNEHRVIKKRCKSIIINGLNEFYNQLFAKSFQKGLILAQTDQVLLL